MKIPFYKYQGTGNDFIMIDNRSLVFPKGNKELIENLCDRHFGVGADGIILIEENEDFDFRMIYYNADSSETFCGNGGRCAVAFAKHLNLIESKANFVAYDGEHYAEINNGIISLKMIDVEDVQIKENHVFAFTGTQHHVEIVDSLEEYPVFENGKKIRYSYKDPGSNVNFTQKIDNNTFRVRTYEKGVEDETLACGTGVTAVAVAMHTLKKTSSNNVKLLVEGGELTVAFKEEDGKYTNVILSGPAEFVFKGEISI